MRSTSLQGIACTVLTFACSVHAQTASTSGYVGYNLTLEGDQDSAVYSTDDTRPDAGATEPDPDIFLNATVLVQEIDLTVDNLTAKVNLDLQVLNLLTFNAGVDLSIDAVRLLIQGVKAKVLLEARLENVVKMVSDVLDSLDLNPIIAELGKDVGSIVNTTTGALGSTLGSLDKRSYDLVHGVVYSINNYAGDTHTNRVLAQNGDLVDMYLDNDGNPHGQKVVGSFSSDMTWNGYEKTVERDGEEVQEREYLYSPYHGINVVSAVYTDATGKIVGTQVLAESSAGGSSTIGDL
ncbi:hypothetical protein LTR78_007894 [Recurvomyces mirabilis]|uniref:Uncharacterized protein n=1 Tax=Recurvomyces mirabilis TaxID=574656 RepID=A0AAE0TQU6_9PEZI|nr:hypothetical protein LTR78_007894 [Recurvomyces mirabilis]KAK5152429.1 hypothetical protein LTS14_008376 [Recurvomyces mirabilis]